MSTTINALNRGGYSAYGSAHFDARAKAVIIDAACDEVLPISASFPSAISSIVVSAHGIASTTPAITGSSFTATLSSLASGGCVDYAVTLATGEVRRLSIVANGVDLPTAYDYGRFAP